MRETITWEADPTEDGDDVTLEFEVSRDEELIPVWGYIDGKQVQLEYLMGEIGDRQLEREYAAANNWWFRGGGLEEWESDVMADEGMDRARERSWE